MGYVPTDENNNRGRTNGIPVAVVFPSFRYPLSTIQHLLNTPTFDYVLDPVTLFLP